MQRKSYQMIRIDKCTTDKFMNVYKHEYNNKPTDWRAFKKARFTINGYKFKLRSFRYQTFLMSGISCVKCGLKISFFAFEKNIPDEPPHANAYGVLKDGTEVLFTKDHIVPASRGGKNNIDNFQTMCYTCNRKKGNKLQ